MTTMIYKRTVLNDCDYEATPDTVEILHDNWDSINAQIAETLERMIPAHLDTDGSVHLDRYEVERWNDMGHEWRIEEMYAEGAMMSELLNSEFVQNIKRMYDYPNAPRRKMAEPVYFAFPAEKTEIAIEQKAMEKYPTTFLHEFNDPDDDEANEFNQERARKAAKVLFAMCDYLRNGARPEHMSWRIAVRHWKLYDYQGRTTITQHLVFTGLSDSAYFNTEMFNGHNITFKDFQRAKNDAEYKAHLAYMKTPEGKAEEKARQQAEADLQTYMGENGLTSYSRNDNGTVTMWRD